MFTKIKDFFLKLRQKDETTKRLWLIVLTSASMLFIIGFWGIYFNATIKNLGRGKIASEPNQFLEIFKNGIKEISRMGGAQLNKSAAKLQDLMKKTNSVTIQNADVNFTVNNLEPVEPQKLP